MNYKEAVEYIADSNKYGSVLGLSNIKELLRRLGNPENKIKIIHIAGTNGKGSTLAYISTILKCAGYKVGRYCSPVVFEYLEKIQIDNKNIEEITFARIATTVMEAVTAMLADGFNHPTSFEIETAMAYLTFYEENCDISVIETGLGGIEDATNVNKSVVCSVITSISMDHMQFLGDNIEKIAAAKAGIIKKDCPVVVYEQDKAILRVIKEKADLEKAEITITNLESILLKKNDEQEQSFSYISRHGNIYNGIKLKLLGTFQIKNAATAIETVEALVRQGYKINASDIYDGLRDTIWNGRFQRITQSGARFYIDGAHNPGAVSELSDTINQYLKGKDIIFIIGVLADKDYKTELSMIAGKARTIITVTPPENTRALSGKTLYDTVKKFNNNVICAASLEKSVDFAYNEADDESVIIAFGSLSYLGELYKIVTKHQTDRSSHDR